MSAFSLRVLSIEMILKNAPAAMLLFYGEEDILIYTNERAETVFGISNVEGRETYRGRDFWSNEEAYYAFQKTILESKSTIVYLETMLRSVDGRQFLGHIVSILYKWEGKNFIFCYVEELRRPSSSCERMKKYFKGSSNRKSAAGKMREKLNGFFRRFQSISTLILAVDRLEEVKAEYGNSIVNVITRLVGDVVGTHLGENDFYTTHKNGKIIVVLPDADLTEALTLGNMICESVICKPYACQEECLKITISIGVAAKTSFDFSAEDMMQRAYASLLLAQRSGGNRVVG